MEATHGGLPVGQGLYSYGNLLISNKASGGEIDIGQYHVGELNQTTAYQEVTFTAPPNPNLATFFTLINRGTTGVWAYKRFIPAGASHEYVWSVSAQAWRRTASGPQLIDVARNLVAPSDTNDNAVHSIQLPANLLGTLGAVRQKAKVTVPVNGNAKTIRTKYGTTTLCQFGIAATSATQTVDWYVEQDGSTSAQIGQSTGNAGTGGSANSYNTGSVDTTTAVTINFCVQKGSAGDTVTVNSLKTYVELWD